MSSEQSLPGSDLRSAAQDYKRDAEHKAKWAMGTRFTRGRGEANPRPRKVSEMCNPRRFERSEAATLAGRGKAKLSRKQEMLAAGDEYSLSSEESGASGESDNGDTEIAIPADANVVYSYDSRSPSQGSQILNTALAKAIEQYEDKETTKLVRNEYEVLDAKDDAHELGLTLAKPKLLDAEDAEYEFV